MTHQSRFVVPVCLLGLGIGTVPTLAESPDCASPEFMTRADVRGLATAEVSPDAIDVSVYGYATYPSACVSQQTMFEAASLTKPAFAYLVLRLADRGRLGLDDALIDLLPSLPLPKDDPRSKQVTVRMALSHSTGLDGPDDRMLRFVDEPGKRFEYYPAGYRLIQRAIEHIESAPLEKLMQREVFKPLGMRNSSVVYRAEYADRLATRHLMLGEPLHKQREPRRPANAAASLLTTADDYGRFLQAMLRGTGLSPAMMDDMLKPQITSDKGNGTIGWGLGWGLDLKHKTFFHWGDDGATKCFTQGSRESSRAFVYFTNSYYGMALAGDLSERFFPDNAAVIAWLGYHSWDSPECLAKRDTVKAFVEGGVTAGMRTFGQYRREHRQLDMYKVAYFVAWILDLRSLHKERARLLAWQIKQRPDDVDLYLNRVRSLLEIGDQKKAIKTLRSARKKAEGELRERIDRQIASIKDDLKS
ncbi:MAG: serine hydrolase domain-containing protein [Phycisphaerae bacterium]